MHWELVLSSPHPDAIILTQKYDITQLPGFEQGWFLRTGEQHNGRHIFSAAGNEKIFGLAALRQAR